MALLDKVTTEVDRYAGWGGWTTEVLIVIALTLLLYLLQRQIIKRLMRQMERTATLWDDALVEALRKPVVVLVWLVGIAFAASIIEKETGASIFGAIAPIRDLGVILIITWFMMRFIRNVQNNIIEQRAATGEFDRTTADAISKLARLSTVIIAALVALQTMGYSISGVLAFGGVGGIAVGFAAKDLLANFFGGLMLYLDRPFAVGDLVRSPDRNIEGVVENIGWRQTCIRTPDKRPLYIPNSIFANIALENPSRMSHRRIFETIGLRYDDIDKLENITTDIEAMLRSDAAIDHEEKVMVCFNSFGPSSLDVLISAYTRATDGPEFQKIKHRILLQIHTIVARHDAEFAFPTSTVHVPNGVRIESSGS
jgi:MscS family membrane protein